jgi:hypothetical protein
MWYGRTIIAAVFRLAEVQQCQPLRTDDTSNSAKPL